MANLMDKSHSYGITQSLIDTVVFYGANMIGHKLTAEIPKAGGAKTIIFLGSDLAIRNSWITFYKEKFLLENKSAIDLDNAYIATVSFILGTLYDLLKDKDIGKAVADNLINNALGLGGNIIVDNLMTNPKYM